MQALNPQRHRAAWSLAVLVLLMMGVWAVLQPSPVAPASAGQQHAFERARLLDLLEDGQNLDKNWLTKAKLATADLNKADEPLRRDLLQAWTQLLADVEAVQSPASQVLQLENIAKSRALLQPYLKNSHAETSKLANELDGHLKALLHHAPANSGAAHLITSWQSLDEITDHTDLIQVIITGMRRLSQSGSSSHEPKFSLGLFSQLSVTFPTAVGREFENIAKRLVQRRWAMLYLLEKASPASALTLSQPPVSMAWGMLLLAVVGLIGVVLLVRQQGQIQDWQHQAQLAVQTAEALQERLRQAQVRESEPQAQDPSAAAIGLPQNFAHDLSDLRGRIKHIQLRFDTGQSLDAAVQDLVLVDERLIRWERALAESGPRGAADV